VATSKRERQKAGHHARLNAERAAWSRYRRRRRLTLGALIVAGLLAAGVLVVALSRSGDDTSVATATTTTASTSPTSTATPLESAAGKPCVALADPLPEGAPEVPVPVGAPPTELVVEDLVVGSVTPAALGDEISVNYIGVSCSTGKIFDSSYSRGEPASFPLTEGGLIKGWTDGIPGMAPGGQRLLVIPPDLGYGASGSGTTIAPDETLVFVVELESATAPSATTTAAP
jgi:peptidylprolyl isomerase